MKTAKGLGDYLYAVSRQKENMVYIDRTDFPGIPIWVEVQKVHFIRHAYVRRWSTGEDAEGCRTVI